MQTDGEMTGDMMVTEQTPAAERAAPSSAQEAR